MNTELLKSKLLEAAFNGSFTHTDTSKWEEVKLGDLMNITTGKKDANFGVEDGEYVFFTCSKTPLRSKSYSYDGDYLIMPGNGANIGKVLHYNGKFEAYQRTYLLQPKNDNVNLDFVKLHLMCKWEQYNNDKVFGAATPFIKLGNLTEYPLHLPPVIEQKKIVAAIEEGFAAIDAIAEAKENLSSTAEMLRNKILQAAFDGSLTGADTSTWKYVTLDNICSYGKCENVDIKDIPNDSWILELEDIEKDTATIIQRLTLVERNIKGTRHKFHKGQLLYSKLRTYLNKVLIAPEDGYCTSEIIPITFRDGVCTEYMCHYMRSTIVLQYTAISGYGIKMPRVNPKQMNSLEVPLPPLAEQKRIVAKIEELFAEIDKLKNKA